LIRKKKENEFFYDFNNNLNCQFNYLIDNFFIFIYFITKINNFSVKIYKVFYQSLIYRDKKMNSTRKLGNLDKLDELIYNLKLTKPHLH
jgi:hypothetical protein